MQVHFELNFNGVRELASKLESFIVEKLSLYMWTVPTAVLPLLFSLFSVDIVICWCRVRAQAHSSEHRRVFFTLSVLNTPTHKQAGCRRAARITAHIAILAQRQMLLYILIDVAPDLSRTSLRTHSVNAHVLCVCVFSVEFFFYLSRWSLC